MASGRELHFRFITLLCSFSEKSLSFIYTCLEKNKHSNSNKPDGIHNLHISRGVQQEAKEEEMIDYFTEIIWF